MHMNRPKNNEVRENPAGENNRAPEPMSHSQKTMERKAPSKGSPLPIPSTRGYVGRRIK